MLKYIISLLEDVLQSHACSDEKDFGQLHFVDEEIKTCVFSKLHLISENPESTSPLLML